MGTWVLGNRWHREGGVIKLTADWTMEQRMSSIERVVVDSGTQAGIHVPDGDF